MCYLGDSWQIHQCEIDNVRGEDLQMDGFITDPLQGDRVFMLHNTLRSPSKPSAHALLFRCVGVTVISMLVMMLHLVPSEAFRHQLIHAGS